MSPRVMAGNGPPEDHDDDCRYRIAATCAAAIDCEHGYDACPECDPCTCKTTPSPKEHHMSEQPKPDDIVIVHHEIAAIAGERGALAELLQRGRVALPEDHLIELREPAAELDPIQIALLAPNPTGGLEVSPGTMTWLNPRSVTHISPADPDLARAVLRAFEQFRAKQSGLVVL